MKKTLALLMAVLMAMTFVLVSCGEDDHPDAIAAAEELNETAKAMEADSMGMMKISAEAKGKGVIVTMEIASAMMDMVEVSGQTKEDMVAALESEFAGSPFDNEEMVEKYPGVESYRIIIKSSSGEEFFNKEYKK